MEVKPLVPRRKIIQHVNHPYSMRYFVGNIHGLFREVFPASLLGVPAAYCQRTVLSESGMIKTQIGEYSR
jgi:hypothetical protein